MRQTIPLLLALASTPALAQETRQMDAHEHGVGTLNIAVDGKDVLMEFHAPGADIVGFEYGATSEADVAAVDGAIAVLGRPFDLFAISDAAGCAVAQVNAELEGGDAHGDEHDDHDHEDKEHADEDHADAHDHADEHDHDKHAHDEHDHDKHDHEEHAHDDHSEEASHTEFHAEYRLTCADPSAIDRMTFPYFDAFENAREVEVQIVTGDGARAFEVTRDAPAIDLRGLF